MRYLLVTCLLLANGCVVIDYLRDEDTVPRDCDDDDPSVIECPDTEPPEDTGDTEPPEDTGDDTSDTQPGPLDPMGRRG